MAQAEFLQGEITERFLPTTGVDQLSSEDGQVAFSTLGCAATFLLYTLVYYSSKLW